MTTHLIKAGANWVDGDRFFDREAELEALRERVQDGSHTLLTAQRRMGKTSLVRELLRQLEEEGDFATVFVDLEAANNPADAVAEIAIRAKPVQSAWNRIRSAFANHLRDLRDHIDEVALADLKVKLRAGIDAGNWQQQGDQVFAALAASEKPVVLAIDELPILVNRLLKESELPHNPRAEGRRGPVSRLAQEERPRAPRQSGPHRLRQREPRTRASAGRPQRPRQHLSRHWSCIPGATDTAARCLAALAQSYDLDLSADVRTEVCRRLRCCVPHHVQQFFDYLHQHLRRNGRTDGDRRRCRTGLRAVNCSAFEGRSTWSITR